MRLKMMPNSLIIGRLGLGDSGPVHQWFTNTCALHMDKYVPWNTGALAKTVVVNGKINEKNVKKNMIIYDQDYAVYVYFGEGKRFQQDVHGEAGPYWDKRMWSAEKEQVVKEVQNYFDRYGGKQ